jgi:multiple sugar transport system permease protein
MQIEAKRQTGIEPKLHLDTQKRWFAEQTERHAKLIFIMPAVLMLLLLSIFPLIASAYLSLTSLKLGIGGYKLNFIGLDNYQELLLGTEKTHFVGLLAPMTFIRWILLVAVAAALIYFLFRYLRAGALSFGGLLGRILATVAYGALAWVLIRSLGPDGRLGSLSVTLLYVFGGITVQFLIGLGLALLTSQDLKGRRFFRVIFLLPMMITPVGVAYMLRMITDTGKGPLAPLWGGLGLANFSWVTDPWAARGAVILADTWQWIPFMFIVLLAALESQPVDVIEAATVDGAGSWQIFRNITWPAIFPISLTLVLIRMIEAFKILDLPYVMIGGGPGTATESMTLHAFLSWRATDLGSAAAIGYLLLIVVTIFAMTFVNLVRQRSLGNG